MPVQEQGETWSYECGACGASGAGYDDETTAEQALAAHEQFHCPGSDSSAGTAEDSEDREPGDAGSLIETGIDQLLAYVQRNGPVRLDTAADEIGVARETVDRWATSLEDAEMLEMRHSARKGRILAAKQVDKKDEKLEEVRQETEERLGRLADLSSGTEDMEQFQTLLERLKERLREREDETLALEEVLDDEHREALDRYRENLIESEIEVEELKKELDEVMAGMNMMSLLAGEVGYDVKEEEPGLLDRLKQLLPGRDSSTSTFTCLECGKSFDSQHGVKVHRGQVHDG